MFQTKLCGLFGAVATTFVGIFWSAGSAAQEGVVEEVYVTARKRQENLQDVPVAVSAIGAEAIEELALQDLSDISKLTAGLVFDNEFGRISNRPVIRGQANILGDSGVSYFIDGVYITGSIADYDLNDIERLEVVKGPQSALYGRNTYAGAINIVTKSPGEEVGGRVQVDVGEDSQLEFSGTLRGPLSDTLSGGVTVRHYELGGAFTNAFDGSDIGEEQSRSVSGVLVFEPNERLRVRGRAYYNDLQDGQPALYHQAAAANNCFTDNGTLYGGLGRYYCGTVAPGTVNTDFSVSAPDARREADTLQTSLAVDVDLNDKWALTSITGYNKSNSIDVTDGDYQPTSFQTAVFTPGGFPFAGFPVPPFDYAYVGSVVDFTFSGQEQSDDLSQELRFTYTGDKVEAIVGGYYFDQSVDSRDVRRLEPSAAGIAAANFGAAFGQQQAACAANPVCGSIVPFFGPTIDVPRDRNDLDIRNTALFGLVSWDLAPDVGMTVEARYQSEKIEQNAVVQDLGGPVQSTVNVSETFDSFSPRVTVDWQRSDDSLLYALVATGTKPGGFNSTVAIEAGLPTFDEEDVVSIELGSKNTLADGRVTANAALFFNQIDGYQLTQNARSGANTTSATVNAGDADILGVELEVSARPASVEGLTLTFNYAWTDAEFTSGVDENEGVLLDAADNGLIDCSTGDQFPQDPDDCTSLFGSIDGKQVPRTAEHQLYLDAELRRNFARNRDWEWYLGANLSFESSKYAQVHNFAETGDATLINARFGASNGRYGVHLYGKNLTGEDATPLVLRYADGADSFKRSFVGTLRRDTHFGLRATFQF